MQCLWAVGHGQPALTVGLRCDWLQQRIAVVTFPHSALALLSLLKQVVVSVSLDGYCLVALSLTINETVKWLSLLPTLMQESFWW